MYHEQAIQLPAVDKWPSHFANRKRDLEDELVSGPFTKVGIMGELQNWLVRSHLHYVK
jgi:hypothetical protein